jgi:hypothetical protein
MRLSFPTASAYVMLHEDNHLRSFLLGKSADDFGGDVEEEYGCDEGERKDEDDERVTVKTTTALLAS